MQEPRLSSTSRRLVILKRIECVGFLLFSGPHYESAATHAIVTQCLVGGAVQIRRSYHD